ncbi:MAG: hypothetical protein MZV64_28810 [Ignavibacteriales bacterium]|nr:hypothetical protein [Ignavibacteriales bacterium]
MAGLDMVGQYRRPSTWPWSAKGTSAPSWRSPPGRRPGPTVAELAGIKGIIYRRDGQPFFTGAAADDRRHRSPALPGQAPDPHGALRLPLAGGRANCCGRPTSSLARLPFNCSFCSTPTNWGRQVRGYSPQRAVDEIRWNRDRFGAEVLWFFDDTFNYSRPAHRGAVPPDRPREAGHPLRRRAARRRPRLRPAGADARGRCAVHLLRRRGRLRAGAPRHRAQEHQRRAGAAGRGLGQAARHRGHRLLHLLAPDRDLGRKPRRAWRSSSASAAKADITVSILHIYPGTELEAYAREKKLLPAGFLLVAPRPPRGDPARRPGRRAALQGAVHLGPDRRTDPQVVGGRQKVPIWKKLPDVLRSIRSSARSR